MEEKRVELKAKGSRTGTIVGGVLIVIGVVCLIVWGFSWIVLGVTCVLSIAFWYGCISFYTGELTAFYKQHIVTEMVKELCEEGLFSPACGIPEPVFNSSGLFSKGPDRYHSEDLISGKIDKTHFCCAEIHAEERIVTRDSKGNTTTRWVDIFKGFLFIADFQKDFRGHTVVFRDSWFKFGRGGDRIKLEDIDFEKRFDIYGTDQVEARYLLTPLLMKKLLILDDKFPGKITISFIGSKVIVAIPDTRNHFEANIWKSILEDDTLRNEYQTLVEIVGIINDLNLNLRIWSKQ